MLAIRDLHAWYDRSHVIQGVSLDVAEGEIVSIIGRNGAGKTTTLRATMGLMAKRHGSVRFADAGEILGQPAHRRYHMGLAYVPEDRRIVPGMSVRENIRLGLIAAGAKKREDQIIREIGDYFPKLMTRLDQFGETLSGGEQQMLAIARALAAKPKLIMLDEPSEGIMPVLVDQIFELFVRLRREGLTILLIEQNVKRALEISDRAYIMDRGVIVHHAPAAELLADQEIQDRYCTV